MSPRPRQMLVGHPGWLCNRCAGTSVRETGGWRAVVEPRQGPRMGHFAATGENLKLGVMKRYGACSLGYTSSVAPSV